jgi:hypothetical protein
MQLKEWSQMNMPAMVEWSLAGENQRNSEKKACFSATSSTTDIT